MYEVGGHLMKLAVETNFWNAKPVCPKIIHCLVVIPWKSAHEDMLKNFELSFISAFGNLYICYEKTVCENTGVTFEHIALSDN